MATRVLPSQANPYSSGAVVFDSTPYTEFYIREQQKEQAKDEALDKYFQEWDKSINPAGMRNVDTQDFLNLINENKDFYFKNKAAIKNPALDGGKAYSEWNSRGKTAMGLVSQSKNAAAKEAEYGKIILKAKQDGLPIPESTIRLIEQYRQPIRSANWRDINPEEIEFAPKEFDSDKFVKSITFGIKPNKVENAPVRIPNSIFEKKVTEYKIPKEAAEVMKQRAITAYEKNPTVKYHVDLIQEGSPEFVSLNKIHKEKFGSDIKDRKDVAAALGIAMSGLERSEEQTQESWEAKNERTSAQYDRRAAMSAARQNAAAGAVTSGNIMDEVDAGKIKLGSGKTVNITKGEVFDENNNPYNGEIFIKREYLPSSLYSALNAMGTDDLLLKANKGFNAKIVNGEIVSLGDPRIGNVSRRFLENAQLKLNTEPQKGRQMSFGSSKNEQPKPSTTKTTKKGNIR